MIWLTVVVFVVLLLVLVLAHEFGHFYAAKKAGCKVEEFAFGFPPRLFSIQKGETRYSFNLLPLGGYVKIEGEDMEDPNPPESSFASKSASWRIFILAAGVIMNVVVAALFLSVQAGVGMPTLVTDENRDQLTDLKTYVLDVSENSPAQEAGLKELDRIVDLEGIASPTITEVQRIVDEQAGSPISVEIERQGQHEFLEIVPRVNPPTGEGALGIGLGATGLEKSAWWKAPLVGLERTWQMLVAIVSQFAIIIGRVFSGGLVGESLTGPVGIAIYTNEVTRLGLPYVLEFGALISLNLALINILPIPALDGGRILFVILEKVFGRRFPGKVEQITHTVGFAFLILLMILITVKDVQRFF